MKKKKVGKQQQHEPRILTLSIHCDADGNSFCGDVVLVIVIMAVRPVKWPSIQGILFRYVFGRVWLSHYQKPTETHTHTQTNLL